MYTVASTIEEGCLVITVKDKDSTKSGVRNYELHLGKGPNLIAALSASVYIKHLLQTIDSELIPHGVPPGEILDIEHSILDILGSQKVKLE